GAYTLAEGDIYFNSDSNVFRFYDGSDWADMGAGAGGGGVVLEVFTWDSTAGGSEPGPGSPQTGEMWLVNDTAS
ncbi:MAG: hypothetical protein ABIB11_05235, partial [Candidatus Omnitrophota bacterium]